jgi:membrane associated rhomboid family serine protease
MIPFSDDNPVEHTPYMTWLLIALCVAAFVWEVSLGDRGTDAALAVLGFTPAAYSGDLTPPPSEVLGLPAYATIFTSMFLHGGFLHLAGNMLYLWIFGNNIEEAMGHARYTLFYLVCGIMAALSMDFIDPHSQVPMIGASGAISGVLGAYMLLYPRARVHVVIPLGIILYPLWVRAVWVVGIWFAMQLASAALTDPSQPGTAFWAHVGGFGTGLILTPFLKARDVRFFGPYAPRGPWT